MALLDIGLPVMDGFDLHLTKPVEVPELEAVIARVATRTPGV